MEKYKNKAKHFTSFEKKVFLDILKRYKHIIEIKRNDSTTLKDKEAAWSEICSEYNASQLVTQEVRQLYYIDLIFIVYYTDVCYIFRINLCMFSVL